MRQLKCITDSNPFYMGSGSDVSDLDVDRGTNGSPGVAPTLVPSGVLTSFIISYALENAYG